MGDMNKSELLALVHRQLVHRDFAQQFEGLEDGRRPIVVALPSDALSALAHDVRKVGGWSNVVTPLFDQLLVFNMKVEKTVAQHNHNGDDDCLDTECTVGLLLQRLQQDGTHATYCLPGVRRRKNESEINGTADKPRIATLA